MQRRAATAGQGRLAEQENHPWHVLARSLRGHGDGEGITVHALLRRSFRQTACNDFGLHRADMPLWASVAPTFGEGTIRAASRIASIQYSLPSAPLTTA